MESQPVFQASRQTRGDRKLRWCLLLFVIMKCSCQSLASLADSPSVPEIIPVVNMSHSHKSQVLVFVASTFQTREQTRQICHASLI